ncbi:MAG: hypothetical protein PHC61_10400 [Chitinivibrionales bacterium]|nr:hypothetical protein [Chitinivibrionales bacterium]
MNRKALICFLALVLVVSINTVQAQWVIRENLQGQVDQMFYDNPVTALKIEKQILINLDKSGVAVGGHVRMTNGFDRDMPQKESQTYFEYLNGPRAIWDYWESHNKLQTIRSSGTLSSDWFGNTVRVVFGGQKQVIGTLTHASNSDQYAIKAEGACCGLIYFSMNAVDKIQMMK